MKNKLIKWILVAGLAVSMTGCGLGNSGPDGHTVKHLVASKMYNNVIQEGRNSLNMEKLLGGTTSPSYIKENSEYKELKAGKSHFIQQLADAISSKGCSKVADSTYKCSFVLTGKKDHKTSGVATIQRAGSVWSLQRLQIN
ncbi:MAG: hypothetical protein ACYCQL_01080 [Acidithiobacillus sp.]